LFPRREGKYKKGEIVDSTEEKLKSADAGKQNLTKHVVNRLKTKLREKPSKITKELSSIKVYKKLRQLQVNKNYKGKREARAKAEAEKEAEKPK
jgi:hypothetical protein